MIQWIVSTVAYLLIAGGCTYFANGGARTFLMIAAGLLAARIFFGIVDYFSGLLVWRIYGKKVAADKMLRWLRVNKFPMRYYEHDSFTDYLARVEEDHSSSGVQKYEAKLMCGLLSAAEDCGVVLGVRLHSATEIALERYSPRKQAPSVFDKHGNGTSRSF